MTHKSHSRRSGENTRVIPYVAPSVVHSMSNYSLSNRTKNKTLRGVSSATTHVYASIASCLPNNAP